MDRSIDPAQTAAQPGPHGSPQASCSGRDLDLDLDRLVWDPEYREAVRPLLRHAG